MGAWRKRNHQIEASLKQIPDIAAVVRPRSLRFLQVTTYRVMTLGEKRVPDYARELTRY